MEQLEERCSAGENDTRGNYERDQPVCVSPQAVVCFSAASPMNRDRISVIEQRKGDSITNLPCLMKSGYRRRIKRCQNGTRRAEVLQRCTTLQQMSQQHIRTRIQDRTHVGKLDKELDQSRPLLRIQLVQDAFRNPTGDDSAE